MKALSEMQMPKPGAAMPVQAKPAPLCAACSDSGIIRLDGRPAGAQSAESSYRLFQGRQAVLCSCAVGQWWLNWWKDRPEKYPNLPPQP
jgi:hypothetical protein